MLPAEEIGGYFLAHPSTVWADALDFKAVGRDGPHGHFIALLCKAIKNSLRKYSGGCFFGVCSPSPSRESGRVGFQIRKIQPLQSLKGFFMLRL